MNSAPQYGPIYGPTVQITDFCYITHVLLPPQTLAVSIDQWEPTTKEWQNTYHTVARTLRVGNRCQQMTMSDWNNTMMPTTMQQTNLQNNTQTSPVMAPQNTDNYQQVDSTDNQQVTKTQTQTTKKRTLLHAPQGTSDPRRVPR